MISDDMLQAMSLMKAAVLELKDLDKSIELAEIYATILWAADLSIYDAPDIEVQLIERCSLNETESNIPALKKDCLHVITEPYMIGGHTRLMEQLATMHTNKPDILVTRASTDVALLRTKVFFDNAYVISAESRQERISKIFDIIKNYTKIVLHTHPNDIEAIISCGVLKRKTEVKVFFVNHADHVFTYGSSVADIYFEISSYGKSLDNFKKITGKKSFLGIPVANKNAAAKNINIRKDGALNFFSAASATKFKPSKGFDIRPAIESILSEYKRSVFWIVGANLYTSTWWWVLKVKYGRRFKVIPALPYISYCNLLEKADFYMDSYPLPGGTAFCEQVLSGRKCIGLISPVQGYSPADKLKSADLTSLMSSISQESNDLDILKLISLVNGYESVKSRYLKCLYSGEVFSNMMEDLTPWAGSFTFFQQDKKITVAIPPAAIMRLMAIDFRLCLKIIKMLSRQQQFKMILKILIIKAKFLLKKTR